MKRKMDEIFSPADMRRNTRPKRKRPRVPEIVNVIWGKSEPMPHDDAVEALVRQPDADLWSVLMKQPVDQS